MNYEERKKLTNVITTNWKTKKFLSEKENPTKTSPASHYLTASLQLWEMGKQWDWEKEGSTLMRNLVIDKGEDSVRKGMETFLVPITKWSYSL